MTAKKTKNGGLKFTVTLNGVVQEGKFTIQEIVDKTEPMLQVLSMYGPVEVKYTPVREAD